MGLEKGKILSPKTWLSSSRLRQISILHCMVKAITGDEEGREIAGKEVISLAWKGLEKTTQSLTVRLEG